MAEHEHACDHEHEHSHGQTGDADCRCSGSASELVRFSVTAPDDLLRRFDEQIARRGDVANRSEAVRDLIRASIAKEQMRTPDEQVIGKIKTAGRRLAHSVKCRVWTAGPGPAP